MNFTRKTSVEFLRLPWQLLIRAFLWLPRNSSNRMKAGQRKWKHANFFIFIFIFILLYFTLQYCIGFAIHHHESSTGVHVFPILNPLPPPSLYHLSGSSQCTSPKHPVSYIKSRLAIHFLHDILHVSMSFSQIIPPSPSPRVQSLFYTSVSILLSHIQGYYYHLSKLHIYMCVSIPYWCFSFWLTSLCIIGSSVFFLMAE